MTAMADVTQKLRELEAQELSAWTTYRERLRDLTGEAYERAEDECWQELQRELDAFPGGGGCWIRIRPPRGIRLNSVRVSLLTPY